MRQLFRATRNIGIGVVARGWSQITAMSLAIEAARVLGRHDFGVYAIASVFIILLQGLMYGGIYDYIIKDRSDFIDHLANTCFWLNLAFSTLGAVGIILIAPIISSSTHSPAVMSLMLALAPSALLASIASWQEALLLRQGRLKSYYGLLIATETVSCGVALGLLFSGFGLWSFVVYRYAQLALIAAGYFALLRQVPRFEWDASVARMAIGFSSNIYASRLVGTISNYSADILVGLLVSPAAAGAYRLGSRIVLGVSEIAYQPVGTMAWVQFARVSHNEKALRREWLGFVAALSLTAWPALAGLALLSGSVVHLVMGPGWEDAVPVIVVLAAGKAMSLFEVFLDPLLGVQNRSAGILKLRTLASVLSIASLVVLARYGAGGAAVAQIIVSMFLAVAGIYVGLRATHLRGMGLLATLVPGLTGVVAALAGAVSVSSQVSPAYSLSTHIALSASAGLLSWGAVLFFLFRLHVFSLELPMQGVVQPELS